MPRLLARAGARRRGLGGLGRQRVRLGWVWGLGLSVSQSSTEEGRPPPCNRAWEGGPPSAPLQQTHTCICMAKRIPIEPPANPPRPPPFIYFLKASGQESEPFSPRPPRAGSDSGKDGGRARPVNRGRPGKVLGRKTGPPGPPGLARVTVVWSILVAGRRPVCRSECACVEVALAEFCSHSRLLGQERKL